MKPTLRRNGHFMITFRVEHVLGREEMTAVLAIRADRGRFNAPDEVLSKGDAEFAIREHLWLNGNDVMAAWANCSGSDEADELWEWAQEQVARLWPSM